LWSAEAKCGEQGAGRGQSGKRAERLSMRSLNKSAGEEELTGLNGNSSDSIYTIKNKWITDW